jgi:hypothetical protein
MCEKADFLASLPSLEIDSIREEFMDLDFRSAGPDVGLVLADTGTGKTTRIPLWLLNSDIPFILVEPRRVVVKTVWSYLRKQVSTHRIGYQIRFEKELPDHALGLVVTPGIFLNYLQAGFPFKPVVVILDEFHERQKELDFILAIHQENPQFKLVILSATLDEDALRRYLSLHLFRVRRQTFAIEISHEEGQVLPGLADLGERVHRALSLYPWRVALVFLPGKREIFDVLTCLKAKGIQAVFPIFGGQSLEEQEAILYGSESRVLLATNLLESAITVEGVDLVVDSGLCRALSFREGCEVLSLEVISNQSAIQRAGRTGRTGPGHCHRLWGRAGKLEEKSLPEILRTDLSDLLMRANHMGIEVDTLQFLDPPHEYQWEFARKRLRELHYETQDSFQVGDYGMSLAFLAVARAIQKKAPELLSYYLFFVALAESGAARLAAKSSNRSGLNSIQETLPVDWVLWKKSWTELQRNWGQDLGPWRKLLQHFLDRFGVDNFASLRQKMTLNQRREFISCVVEAFPKGLFYACSREEWGNDFSQRVIISGLDPKEVAAVYVLSFFEMETARRKRVVLAEIYWPLEKKGGYKLPKTRFEVGDLVIHKGRAFEIRRWFFGSKFLEDEQILLEGEGFRERFSHLKQLEKSFPGLTEEFFYLELLNQETGDKFQETEFLKQGLHDLGAESFADFDLLELKDFLPQDLILEKPRLQSLYPRELSEPGGKYAMRYNLASKTVIFAQAKGGKEPSRLLTNRFPSWKKLWEYKGRSIELG